MGKNVRDAFLDYFCEVEVWTKERADRVLKLHELEIEHGYGFESKLLYRYKAFQAGAKWAREQQVKEE